MANIVILGAGVMGSALSVPAAFSNNVTIIGSPLDDAIVDSLQATAHHPGLDVKLPGHVEAVRSSSVNDKLMCSADVIVIGVSSPGVSWAINEIKRYGASPAIVALVTKGLVASKNSDHPPDTYAQHLSAHLDSPAERIVGIGGPCIARELALRYPTYVSFAGNDLTAANRLRELLQTDYYRVTTHSDFTGLEACAALKNFMCIGVSAMFSAFEFEGGHAKNPLAALFNQAVHEIALLSDWIVKAHASGQFAGGYESSAFGLAGMGDLHVTVGGGRNSRLGRHLGSGQRLQHVLDGPMRGVTVEGVDTGRQLLAGYRAACVRGDLDEKTLPLTNAILSSIDKDRPFEFDFSLLPG